MVEDALRNSRNLHRLLLAVNLAGLVLAMSLTNPTQERLLVHGLQELRSVEFLNYDRFVDGTVRSELRKYFTKWAESLKAQLRPFWSQDVNRPSPRARLYLEPVDDLSFSLAESIEPRRFMVRGSPLEHIGSLTVEEIARVLRSPDARESVRVPRPDMWELEREILNVAGAAQRFSRISDLKVASTDEQEQRVTVEFILRPPAYHRIPIYERASGKTLQANVGLVLATIGRSSLLSWLEAENQATHWDFQTQPPLIRANDRVVAIPLELLDRPLVEALEEARQRLRQQSPESKHLNLIGTEIPGRLAVLAVPLASLVLLLYLLGSLLHLRRLADDHHEEMTTFSWLSLTLSNDLTWRFEVIGTLFVLPLAANTLLLARLSIFGTPDLWLVAVGATSGVAALWIGLRIYHQLRELRDLLRSSVP